MSGAWQGSTRRKRLPADWEKIRKRIMRRDGYRCTETIEMPDGSRRRCPGSADEVDHIRPGDDHSDANLRSLCNWHHQRKSSREGAAAFAKRRAEISQRFRRDEGTPRVTR